MELHFSPGVKGVEEEGSAPTGCGFRPASSEVGLRDGIGGLKKTWETKPGDSMGDKGVQRLEALIPLLFACDCTE